MTTAHHRYLAVEASIGAAISAMLSFLFCMLLFGGEARVAVGGPSGLVVDAIPQGFMIALMSSLVPTLLTRRRVRLGAVARREGRQRLPTNLLLRVLVFACGAAGFSVALTAALLWPGPANWPFAIVAIGKTLYGALLGGSVAALATHAALADGTA